MTNQIESQDKNQLSLFDLLTRDQEFEKSRIISRNNDFTNKMLNQANDKKEFLILKGFQEGVHFTSNYEVIKEVVKRNVGNYNESVEVEIELNKLQGGIYLIYNRYDAHNNKISLQKSEFTLEYGKLNCYGLQDYSSRMLKPETMLTKIQEANEKAESDFESANKKNSIIDYTIEKYSKLFPQASVTKSTESERHGHNRYSTFDTVLIKFENGNSVYLRLGFEVDREYVWKKINVTTNQMSIVDLLDYYSK